MDRGAGGDAPGHGGVGGHHLQRLIRECGAGRQRKSIELDDLRHTDRRSRYDAQQPVSLADRLGVGCVHVVRLGVGRDDRLERRRALQPLRRRRDDRRVDARDERFLRSIDLVHRFRRGRNAASRGRHEHVLADVVVGQLPDAGRRHDHRDGWKYPGAGLLERHALRIPCVHIRPDRPEPDAVR